MELTFTWDSRDLEVFRSHAVERALDKALGKAGSDAIRFMKAGSSRLLRQRKRFRVSRVNRSLPLTFGHLAWRMDVSGAPVPVVDFPHSQTRRGVSVAINTGKRTLIRSAFIATMKSGHTGIFTRRGKKRLPIDEAFSTKISDVFGDRDFIPFIQEGAQARFHSAFARIFPLELKK